MGLRKLVSGQSCVVASELKQNVIMLRNSCMNLRVTALVTISIGALSLMGKGIATDAKAPDPDLPQPLDLNMAEPLIKSSPFTRELNLSDTIKLTGLAYVEGKTMATLINRVTKQSYVVTEEPNAMGWRLAGVNASSTLNRTEVKIVVGSETVTLHYSEIQASSTRKGSVPKGYMPSKIPTPEEFTGHDEKGAYVRGSPYLNDEDRNRFRNGISREVRDKFVKIVHDNREMMFKSSPEERAAIVKQALDTAEGK